MGTWIEIAHETDIGEGDVRPYDAAGLPVAVFRVGGELYALHDLCTHGAARLSDGWVDGACVECPLHQGLVEIATGQPRSAPIVEPSRTYRVRVVDGRVEVEV
jgi:anthranilate 1,2-dioxygenase ferredoxin component